MINTKHKPTQSEIARQLWALDILSGRADKPDYQGRRDDMRKIHDMILTQEEYKELSDTSANIRGL